MKKFRNWVTFAVVLAMVLSLAVGVSATSGSKSAGIYGMMRASSYQSESKNLLITNASVQKNEDNAYFVTTVKLTNSDGTYPPSTSYSSSRGATSFNPSVPIYFNIETSPTYAFVCHEIRGGTSGGPAYLIYTETSISVA